MARLGKRMVERRGAYQSAAAGGVMFIDPFDTVALNLLRAQAAIASLTADITTVSADSTAYTADQT